MTGGLDRLAGMTEAQTHSIFLASDEDTARFAAWWAGLAMAGDTFLLSGQIGAGKSHFARAFIRARLGQGEEVPSPSFTLVQTYGDAVEIWHSDLYRLSHPDEVLELGLDEAFSSAICLVEWPDRLGALAPASAISISLRTEAEGRRAEVAFVNRADLRARLLRDWPK